MCGECDTCGEHTLECHCNPSRNMTLQPDDLHNTLVWFLEHSLKEEKPEIGTLANHYYNVVRMALSLLRENEKKDD
jgi:hypothetical protein